MIFERNMIEALKKDADLIPMSTMTEEGVMDVKNLVFIGRITLLTMKGM